MNSNIGWPVPGFLKDIYQDIRNQEMNQIQETIETAIRNGTSVWIDYTDEGGKESKGREVKPSFLFVKTVGSGFEGTDPAVGYRSFRLDRVSKVYTSKPVEEWNEGDIIERTDGHKFVVVREAYSGLKPKHALSINGAVTATFYTLAEIVRDPSKFRKVGTLAASVK
jgi:hypothetical protein